MQGMEAHKVGSLFTSAFFPTAFLKSVSGRIESKDKNDSFKRLKRQRLMFVATKGTGTWRVKLQGREPVKRHKKSVQSPFSSWPHFQSKNVGNPAETTVAGRLQINTWAEFSNHTLQGKSSWKPSLPRRRGSGLVPQSCLTLLWSHELYARQAPLSMGFPRQKCWNGVPFPSPGRYW